MSKLRFSFLLLAALTLMIAYVFNASASTIIGKIMDTSGRPADDVIVLLSNQYQYTDSNGRFRFRNISTGSHTLEIKKKNRTIKRISIDVNDPTETIDIQL